MLLLVTFSASRACNRLKLLLVTFLPSLTGSIQDHQIQQHKHERTRLQRSREDGIQRLQRGRV